MQEINSEDTADIVEWRNNKDLGRFLGRGEKLTIESQNKFLNDYFKKNDFYFIAKKKDTKVAIGAVALYDVDLKAKRNVY